MDPAKLEETFVKDVYENIASHFDHTRYSQWTGVKRFLFSLSPYSLILDVGCGNGKYLIQDSRMIKIGCDRSLELCKICNDKGYSVFAADCLALPVVQGRFDAILSIAVIHHLSTEDRRLRAIKDLLGLLRPGGRALIYVWAFEQSRKGEKSVYLKSNHQETSPPPSSSSTAVDQRQPESMRFNDDVSLPIHENGTQFTAQDMLVPWTKSCKNKEIAGDQSENSDKFLRFYHVFKEGELEELCSRLSDCSVRQSFYELGNWCVELEKR